MDAFEYARIGQRGRSSLLGGLEAVECTECMTTRVVGGWVRSEEGLQGVPDARLPVHEGSVAVEGQDRMVGEPAGHGRVYWSASGS